MTSCVHVLDHTLPLKTILLRRTEGAGNTWMYVAFIFIGFITTVHVAGKMMLMKYWLALLLIHLKYMILSFGIRLKIVYILYISNLI